MSTIEKTLDDLEDSIRLAEASFQIWWGISHHGIKDYSKQLNNYSYVDFFHASIPIFLQGILINLSRIFDRGSDLSGIKKLKNELTLMGEVSAIKKIEIELSKHEKSIRSIKGIRDQSVAHLKHVKTVSAIYEENPITPDQMKELISAVKYIITIASKQIGRDSTVLSSKRYLKATLELFEALKI